MSKRARRVGKEIADQNAPFHYSTWVEEESHRHEIHALLAPAVVRADGLAAVGLALSCKAWRNAIKPEIIKYMKDVNKKFAKAQDAARKIENMGQVSIASAIARVRRTTTVPFDFPMDPRDPRSADNELVKSTIVEMQNELLDWRRDVNAFRTLQALGENTTQKALKAVSFLCNPNEDPRQDREKSPYILGEETCHAYGALAQSTCEVCAPIGKKHRCGGLGFGFSPAPFAHGKDAACFRLLSAPTECVRNQCFRYNAIAIEPLAPTEHRRGMSKQFHNSNNLMLENALRHAIENEPTHATTIEKRLSEPDRHLIGKHGATGTREEPIDPASPSLRSEASIHERLGRCFWLRKHPTLPPNYSFEAKLRLGKHHFDLAEGDLNRKLHYLDTITMATEKAWRDRLRGDFEALFQTSSELKETGMSTIKELDNIVPGFEATVNRVIVGYGTGIKHILDIKMTHTLLRVAGMAAHDLRRWDQSYAPNGNLASPRAYAWITGLSAGLLPHIRLPDIAVKLNEDPLILNYDNYQWRHVITAMHLFDAVQWDSIKVLKEQRDYGNSAASSSGAGSSADPIVPASATEYRYTSTCYSIGLSVGDAALSVTSTITFPSQRDEWVAMHAGAKNILDSFDLEAELPNVPSQAHIDELVDNDASASMACSWVQCMVQVLAYWPSTRAVAFDILTNNSTRGLVEAVSASPIDLEMLDLARAIKAADGMPLD